MLMCNKKVLQEKKEDIREGNGNPFQYSFLENPTDREAWWAIVQGVARIGYDLVTKPPPPPKMWYIHIVEYYTVIKKNEIMPFAATWSYKSVILSEVSQTEKEKYHMTSFIWTIYGGVNGDLLPEGLCHTQIYCTRAPAPAAVYCWPIPLQETPKHSSGSVSVGSLGPGADKVCLSPPSIWPVWGLILNAILSLLQSCWGFSFAVECGVSFFGGIQRYPVNGHSAMSCFPQH